jgi:hypothetical protein
MWLCRPSLYFLLTIACLLTGAHPARASVVFSLNDWNNDVAAECYLSGVGTDPQAASEFGTCALTLLLEMSGGDEPYESVAAVFRAEDLSGGMATVHDTISSLHAGNGGGVLAQSIALFVSDSPPKRLPAVYNTFLPNSPVTRWFRPPRKRKGVPDCRLFS